MKTADHGEGGSREAVVAGMREQNAVRAAHRDHWCCWKQRRGMIDRTDEVIRSESRGRHRLPVSERPEKHEQEDEMASSQVKQQAGQAFFGEDQGSARLS
jgi:hypothetical protein